MIEMIDITGLREDKRPQSSTIVHALLDRLEAAEKERDNANAAAVGIALKAEKLEEDRAIDTQRMAILVAELNGAERERDALRVESDTRKVLIDLLRAEIGGLRTKIEQMEKQEPVGKFVQHPSNGLWEQDEYGDNPDANPLYALPGAQPAPSLASDDVSLISEGNTQPAQCVKDAIIDDLQSQFDTEGITEHDSGDALIRLSDAIAAVEDNFAQPAPGAPWVSLAERMPNPDKHDRVLIYTEGYDFGGEQVFDVKAEALNECRYIDPDEQPETCKAASHWMPHPRNAIFDYAAHCAQPMPSVPEVTDAMALAFHHALTDGSVGAREVEEIKDALRAALAAAPKPEGE